MFLIWPKVKGNEAMRHWAVKSPEVGEEFNTAFPKRSSRIRGGTQIKKTVATRGKPYSAVSLDLILIQLALVRWLMYTGKSANLGFTSLTSCNILIRHLKQEPQNWLNFGVDRRMHLCSKLSFHSVFPHGQVWLPLSPVKSLSDSFHWYLEVTSILQFQTKY